MSEEPLERANEEEPDSSVSDVNPVKPEEAELTHSAPPGPAVRVHHATTTEYFTDITMVTKQRGSTGNMAAAFLVTLQI